MLLGHELEEVDELGLGADERLRDALPLLRRGEVGAEEEDLELAVLVDRVDHLAELLADLVELPVLLRDPEQGVRVDGSDVVEQALLPLGGRSRQRREVHLRQRLLDQAAMVVLVERLPRHLLGGRHRQVGDLLAD